MGCTYVGNSGLTFSNPAYVSSDVMQFCMYKASDRTNKGRSPIVNISTFIAFGHELPFRSVREIIIINIKVFEGNLKGLGPILIRMFRRFFVVTRSDFCLK
jgi:hypothetical protein